MSGRVTEKQLEVLRLAKDGNLLPLGAAAMPVSVRSVAINRLKVAGYLDRQSRLTIEGARILEDQSR